MKMGKNSGIEGRNRVKQGRKVEESKEKGKG